MRISIPKPCNENWGEMTPNQQGAFCKVCRKTVVDFSGMSDEEIIAYLGKKDEEKTCGRFYASQLAPYELKVDLQKIQVQRSFPKIFALTLFLVFSTLFVCKSDTGDLVSFKINAADPGDTSALLLSMDTVNKAPVLNTPTAQSQEPHLSITGGISVPQEIIRKPDTTIIKPDTSIRKNQPMILGRMACTNPVKPADDNNSPPAAKLDKKMVKGKMMILGDIGW